MEQCNTTVWDACSSKWELMCLPTVPVLFERAGSHMPMTEADTTGEAAMLVLCL